MTVTRKQLDQKGSYQLALEVMKALLRKGLMNEKDFRKARQHTVEQYKPVWVHYPVSKVLAYNRKNSSNDVYFYNRIC